MSTYVGGILGLHAETALHPGAGAALGVVDLPVQRERHTHWPTIPGTALKGVLREAVSRTAKDDVKTLFGGEPGGGQREISAGALSVGDARLLAFPVRSLKGVWAWVTCPAVLERYARDAHMAGITAKLPKFDLRDGQCLVAGEALVVEVAAKKRVVLEEFDVEAVSRADVAELAKELAKEQLPQSDAFKSTRERFERSLVVLSDDDFGHFVRYATEVVARIGLDHERKTVKNGALFYQELLPAETVFYAVVLAEGSRAEGDKRGASEVFARFKKHVPPVVQVGANETTGRGFCATSLRTKGGA
ncbi:MAG: type III-B CRISPR module RAMP protein Cmr4 [Polyangiales bacterium]